MQLVLMAALPTNLGVTQVVVAAVWLFAIDEMIGKVLQGLRDMGVPVPAFAGTEPKPATQMTP